MSITIKQHLMTVRNFAFLALFLPQLSLANDDQTWVFIIDCNQNSSDDISLDSAETNDKITLVLYKDGKEVGSQSNSDVGCANLLQRAFSIDVEYGVVPDTAILTTDGHDALWIDDAALWIDPPLISFSSQPNTDLDFQWGENNSQGWCLSTDEDDWDGGWSDSVPSDKCFSCLKFVATNSSTDNHVYSCD
ncbi:MAG: hypothetical protein V7711_18680 [Pseudomonadales bacterium]